MAGHDRRAPAGNQDAMSWDELVAVALIGTERRAAEVDVPPGAPDELGAALESKGSEERLLGAAAAWAVARRAGARALQAVEVEPVPLDERSLCSAAAGARLRTLIEDEEPRIVAEWLARARTRGVRPLPEDVPALLEFAVRREALQEPVIEAAGPLGLWLAQREPVWGFATDLWADGTRVQRRRQLARLRRKDPAAGLALLEQGWKDEGWEDRAALLEALEPGLSDADEPFLESVLDDPRQEVRTQARLLLAMLPNSRASQRAAAWAKQLVRVEGAEIEVELPGPPDDQQRRDGFDARGRRSERLRDLLAWTPLSTWDGSLVDLPVADDLRPVLLDGWTGAALLQGDETWARALWLATQEPHMLSVLPREEAETLARQAADPYTAASELPAWGQELSRVIIRAIPKLRERNVHIGLAGYKLDPSLEAEVEPLRDLGGRDVLDLCDTVALRAAMLRELA